MRVVDLRLGSGRRTRRWAKQALQDFVAVGGGRSAMVSRVAMLARRVEGRVADRRAGRATEADVVHALLEASAAADTPSIWHRDLRFRSYVDVSLQVKLLRVLLEHAAALDSIPPVQLAAAMAHHAPDSRPGLIVYGELLLDSGEVDGAIDAARRALRIQAVCPTSEDLLLRGYRRKREKGSTDHALRIADLELGDRFCAIPFTHLSAAWAGNAFVCTCPSWVPYSVGNVYEADSPDEVWNSDPAREIRRSILDGDFSYCSRTQCSLMLADALPTKDDVDDPILRRYIDDHETEVTESPRLVELDYDATCNLACPSCRKEIFVAKKADREAFDRAAERVLVPLMKQMDGLAYISGGGEALSSAHYRAVLAGLNREEFPGLRVYLITNGQQFTPKRWSSLPHLPEMLSIVSVSIDAARPATYERLRRPGRWAVLRRNLDYIAELRRAGEIPGLEINLVVQRDNFREMIDFMELGEEVGADRVWFQRLVNYGTYDEATFADLNVSSPLHPQHEELLETLRHLRRRGESQRPAINMDMLLGLLPEFVESDEPLGYVPSGMT